MSSNPETVLVYGSLVTADEATAENAIETLETVMSTGLTGVETFVEPDTNAGRILINNDQVPSWNTDNTEALFKVLAELAKSGVAGYIEVTGDGCGEMRIALLTQHGMYDEHRMMG